MSRFIDMTGWVMKEHGIKDSRWTVIEQAPEFIQPNGKHILVHNRINYGKWCFEEALFYDISQKPMTGKEVICENQTFISVAECARYYKINSRTLNSWLNGDRKMPDDWKRKSLCFKEKFV